LQKEDVMKVLLSVDGSSCSQGAVQEVCHHAWPPGTEIEVLSVVTAGMPFIPEPTLTLVAAYETILKESRAAAPGVVARAAAAIRAAHPDLTVTTRVVEGRPQHAIVEEARTHGSDLIIMGAHGFGAVKRAVLGSVSQSVTSHAPCSVLVVRGVSCERHAEDTRQTPTSV